VPARGGKQHYHVPLMFSLSPLLPTPPPTSTLTMLQDYHQPSMALVIMTNDHYSHQRFAGANIITLFAVFVDTFRCTLTHSTDTSTSLMSLCHHRSCCFGENVFLTKSTLMISTQYNN